MIKKTHIKRIALFLAVFLILSAVPELIMEAHALTIKYKITLRWKLKKKAKSKKKSKKKVYISNKKVNFLVGDKDFIFLVGKIRGKVKWKCSNKKVIAIKKDKDLPDFCNIKAKKKGKATITAIYKGKKYKCKVIVKSANVRLTVKKMHLKIGEYSYINLENRDYDELNSKAKWRSTNKKVAIIKRDKEYGMKITALKKGKTYIVAKYKGKKYKCKVTVNGYSKIVSDCKKTTINFKNKDAFSYFIYFGENENELLLPFKMYYKVEDDSIVNCKLEQYYDNSFRLTITPKSSGNTSIIVTNSYSKQQFKYNIIVG